jgi:hypothetical protein
MLSEMKKMTVTLCLLNFYCTLKVIIYVFINIYSKIILRVYLSM